MKYAIDKDEIRISPCQDDVDSKNYITLYKNTTKLLVG